MAMLLVAVVASLWFQRVVRLRTDTWEVSPAGHVSVRTGAVLVTLLWCVVIAGGRWIAYAPV
jgi:hypothetical protein